ncbi:MAG: cyclodeaminase/cyclohydrolase family protein [Acidobacteriota bacterium]
MLKPETITEFCTALASAAPAPGGGAGAAAGGALGAALVGMVFEHTIEREQAAGAGRNLRQARDTVCSLRKDLLDLIDKDAAACNEVLVALRLPEGTQAEKDCRRESLQKAYMFASEVPVSTAECCLAVLSAAEGLAPRISPQLKSELATGVMLAHSGAHGAILNIEANAPHVRNAEMTDRLRQRCVRLRERADVLRERTLGAIPGREQSR